MKKKCQGKKKTGSFEECRETGQGKKGRKTATLSTASAPWLPAAEAKQKPHQQVRQEAQVKREPQSYPQDRPRWYRSLKFQLPVMLTQWLCHEVPQVPPWELIYCLKPSGPGAWKSASKGAWSPPATVPRWGRALEDSCGEQKADRKARNKQFHGLNIENKLSTNSATTGTF